MKCCQKLRKCVVTNAVWRLNPWQLVRGLRVESPLGECGDRLGIWWQTPQVRKDFGLQSCVYGLLGVLPRLLVGVIGTLGNTCQRLIPQLPFTKFI